MFFSESGWDWLSDHSFCQVGQRVEFVWEANCFFSTSSQQKFFPLMPARLQQLSASWQSLSPKRSKLSMLPDWDTFRDPAQAGEAAPQIDFSFPSWHSLLDFGKHSMEKSSAAAGVQATGSVGSAPSVPSHSAGALGHTPAWGMEAGYDPRWSQGYQVQPGWDHRPGLFHSKAQTSLILRCPVSEHGQEDKVSKSKWPSSRVGRAESTSNNLPAYLNIVPGTTVP